MSDRNGEQPKKPKRKPPQHEGFRLEDLHADQAAALEALKASLPKE